MDWLDRYTDPDSSWTDWANVHRGDGHSVVTDRRCILAVDDPAAGFAELVLRPNQPEVNRVARAALAEPVPAGAVRTDLHDLWLWLDRLDRERCPDCPPDPDLRPFCQDCDGRGWVRLEPDEDNYDADSVVLAGGLVDRWRLCWWLPGELEPLGTDVAVWPSGAFTPPLKAPLTIDGGRWRLVVMTLDPTHAPAGAAGRPRRTYFPGAGLWWACRRCPTARLAAIDWFQDRGVEADEATLFGGPR